LRWPRDTLYPHKLALTSPTSDGQSVGTVRLRSKATDFFSIFTIKSMNVNVTERVLLMNCNNQSKVKTEQPFNKLNNMIKLHLVEYWLPIY
jgi:hypothetical protein